MAANHSPNLFKTLLTDRHWQRFETFQHQFRRTAAELAAAGEAGASTADVSRRQFDRWLAGDVRTLPRPLQCMILERLLRRPVRELFSTPSVPALGPDTGLQPSSDQDALDAATLFASQFLIKHDVAVGDLARETLFSEVRNLCQLYPTAPADAFLERLLVTQRGVLEACSNENRGALSTDLYFLGGVTSGLVAKASQDLGRLESARGQARVALFCAEISGHIGLQGWVKGIQSLISYWAGDLADAASQAAEGRAKIGNRYGSVAAWLPALEARAFASMGDASRALESIKTSSNAADRFEPSDLDHFGGLLTFPVEKQRYYTAEAMVLLDEVNGSVANAEAAVQGYADAEPAFSDKAGATANLALALAKHGDLDGAAATVEPVLNLERAERIHGVVKSVERVEQALLAPKFASSPKARTTLLAIEDFKSTSPLARGDK